MSCRTFQTASGVFSKLRPVQKLTAGSGEPASLVGEARGGPFVFRNGLADACEKAAGPGFDAIEIFAPSTDTVDPDELNALPKKVGFPSLG